ncbi:DUF6547 family protein [Sulfurovum mangrovi]|uniref:DUF6547 family protein n=1 Tax=Sulfurovum mangrovi TaxID=2893889 RepID=UPI001E379F13|nr:DUF6547 family protein [Sulfurovum mangrovi]UFH60244.1 hypothetical protein LN246_05195 [Sulfurovum mangrovi]
MNKNINEYKRFIDDMVKLRPCISAEWVLEGRRWPEVNNDPNDIAINQFVDSLSPEHKKVLAYMLNSAFDSGIHDVLAYFNEESMEGLRICKNGTELPLEPFDTEMHYDFICRSESDQWPDETR